MLETPVRAGRLLPLLRFVVALAAGFGPAALVAAPACYDADACGTCDNANSWPHVTTLMDGNDFGADTADTPIGFVDPNDGLPHRFVPTQEGKIWVFDPVSGTIDLANPYLDLTSKVLLGGERGLLSMALDPDYAATGELYVYYTRNSADSNEDGDIVVERYTRDPNDPDRATLASAELVLLVERDTSQANHNGGTLLFGADGMLYVSIGDGGGGCDDDIANSPHGQKTTTLLGKLLRLDVRGLDAEAGVPECGAAGSSYGVPSTNPLAGETEGCGELWARGLRNPFRMTVDRESGDLWIGDVGQGLWEEINYVPYTYFPLDASELMNFGWRCREGCQSRTCDNTPDDCSVGVAGVSACQYPLDFDSGGGVLPFWDPVLCHNNPDGWKSIIAGSRYRGLGVPEIADRFLYADVSCGQIWATTSFSEADPVATAAECWDSGNGGIYAFAEDHLGELYLIFGSGTIQCVHGGDSHGCYWASWGGLFQDGFDTHGTAHWSDTSE